MKTNDTHVAADEQHNNVPNESSGIYVRGLVKITDPETGEVLLETNN